MVQRSVVGHSSKLQRRCCNGRRDYVVQPHAFQGHVLAALAEIKYVLRAIKKQDVSRDFSSIDTNLGGILRHRPQTFAQTRYAITVRHAYRVR